MFTILITSVADLEGRRGRQSIQNEHCSVHSL